MPPLVRDTGIKRRAKAFLERRGIFLRQVRSVRYGSDPWLDLGRTGLYEKNDPIIFDVGANVGAWTREILARCPRSRIHAFEPNPILSRQLAESLKERTSIIVNDFALGESESTGTLTVFERDEYSSLDIAETCVSAEMQNVCGKIIEKHNVPMSTVDKYCRENNIKQIDILKTDTEGYDLKVLYGAEMMFENDAVRRVFCEFGGVTYRNGINKVALSDICFYLEKFDFKILSVYTGWADPQRGMSWGDVLFVKNEGADN